MLRHHHISHQQKSIPIAHGRQRLHERSPSPRSSQQRQPPVAAKRQKMEMTLSVIAIQSFRHRNTPKPPHVTPTCGAPQPLHPNPPLIYEHGIFTVMISVHAEKVECENTFGPPALENSIRIFSS